jgi:hypothetical protein
MVDKRQLQFFEVFIALLPVVQSYCFAVGLRHKVAHPECKSEPFRKPITKIINRRKKKKKKKKKHKKKKKVWKTKFPVWVKRAGQDDEQQWLTDVNCSFSKSSSPPFQLYKVTVL